MDGAEYSLFMALPTEIRCHIYSYLPDIAYDPVFPKPGICSWEIHIMPTALLQLNKTIFEEVKHSSIQKPLQKLNDQLIPKIVLGPTPTDLDLVYIALSDTFHLAGKRLHTYLGEFQQLDDDVENISLDLASWYNNTYLTWYNSTYPPQQVSGGHEEAFDARTECRPERLHRFVRQTLTRMTVKKTCEIRVRLLYHLVGVLPRQEDKSGDPPPCYLWYETVAALDIERQALSLSMGRKLKMVDLFPSYPGQPEHEGYSASMCDTYQKRGLNFKLSKPRDKDRALFDMAM
jgi:hypothetical protein